ncbi:hypothetical protein AAFP30_28255 [Gordonia sp. CPCC 205515]|uniref:hypothetical protein n=1 Tax=Gordonia sp. CPCC 205515 TaxID=3140791 RepID=UPI003AF39744
MRSLRRRRGFGLLGAGELDPGLRGGVPDEPPDGFGGRGGGGDDRRGAAGIGSGRWVGAYPAFDRLAC